MNQISNRHSLPMSVRKMTQQIVPIKIVKDKRQYELSEPIAWP